MVKQSKQQSVEVEQTVEQSKKVEKKQTKTQEEKKETEQQATTQVVQSEDKFDEHLKTVESAYSEAKKLMHNLHTSIKKLQAVHKSELKRAKVKKSKRSEKHKPTGFARLRPVVGKMAEFIGVESGTELSGPEITAKVWSVLKSRGLTHKGDKAKGEKGDQRVLRVDKEVSELFFVPMSVNKSTLPDDEEGFNFGNLQFYIKQAMEGKKLEKKPRKQKEVQQKTETVTVSNTEKKTEKKPEKKSESKTLTK
jgi:hypothetical protein